MKISSAIMIIVELIFISFLVYDPCGLYPDEDTVAKIEQKVAEQVITPLQGKAEVIMYFAAFWIVGAIAKFWLQFNSATHTAAMAVPLFIFGYRMNEAGIASACLWGIVSLIFMSSIMFSFHTSLWWAVGEDWE